MLEILPESVAGVDVNHAAEASQATAASELDPAIEALAFGLAAAPPDFLIASVVRLRPGAFDEEFFRRWRDSYGEGVCGSAGGLRPGTAEVELGGRNVFVGSCVNGGHTHFVWLPSHEAIVSSYSVGNRAMGERLMESLEE